jgi:molybdopterin-binding protein
MKLSARNVLKGRVLQVVRGKTTGHVKLDVGGGTVITASITMEAIAELKLRRGDTAYAGHQSFRRHRGEGLTCCGGAGGRSTRPSSSSGRRWSGSSRRRGTRARGSPWRRC